jgi:hypothetical protein
LRVVASVLTLLLAALTPLNTQAQTAFDQDLQALTADPHRLAGTAENQRAVEYITQRLQAAGVDAVLPLDMSIWQARTEQAELQIDGQTLELAPMRPNLIVQPTTPAQGLTGPLIYAGRGRTTDYGTRDPYGAIVVLDYQSMDRWKSALMLGASAVIFLDDGQGTSPEPKFTNVPINAVRMYAQTGEDGTVDGVDLTQDRDVVTLHSAVTWRQRTARNVVALIGPGAGQDPLTQSNGAAETLVLAAPIDSFGEVPTRSPGARNAANAAALLAAADRLVQDRPRRNVLLMFLNQEAYYHQGAREVYEALLMEPDLHEQRIEQHRQELRLTRDMLALLRAHGLLFGGQPEEQLLEALTRDDDAEDELIQRVAEARELLAEAAADQAEWMRADVNLDLRRQRLAWQRIDDRAELLAEGGTVSTSLQALDAWAPTAQDGAAHDLPTQGLDAPLDPDAVTAEDPLDLEPGGTLADGIVPPPAPTTQARPRVAQSPTESTLDERARRQLTERSLIYERNLLDFILRAAHGQTSDPASLADFVSDRADLARGAGDDEAMQSLVDDERRNAVEAFAGFNMADAGELFGGWDDNAQLRADATRRLGEDYGPLVQRVQRQVETRLDRRLAELSFLLQVDQQRTALREATWSAGEDPEPPAIVLHAVYNLSGGTGSWGLVAGDWTWRLYRGKTPGSGSDDPGFYSQVLAASRTAAYAAMEAEADRNPDDPAAGSLAGLSLQVLQDATYGETFVPGAYVSSGAIAGMHEVYNLSAMTGHDARSRDGHPADTVDNLALETLARQAAAATELFAAMSRSAALSGIGSQFRNKLRSKYPQWDGERSSGDFVAQRVTGSLSENRPAPGALVALWGAGGNDSATAWQALEPATLPHYSPVLLANADGNGRLRLIGMHSDIFAQPAILAALYDDRGGVRAITTEASLRQRVTSSMRIDLFSGSGHQIPLVPAFALRPAQLSILQATSDTAFRDNMSLTGQGDGFTFFYFSDIIADNDVKVFQPLGPVALNPAVAGDDFETLGYPATAFDSSVWPTRTIASDMYALNESRLSALRRRSVTSPDLERLHGNAGRKLEQAAEATTIADREALLRRSAALSSRAYQPLRSAMDDLVHSVVLLLLLAIPFAFAMERLLVCATSIYGRIAGFVVIFLVTFGLLYFMHPGFAIASTPVIIFLAFAIILLSSLVIYIVVRKFRTELKAIQGQGGGHDLDSNKAGTMLAAVNMGMSTMRRRPTRTLLTAITTVMLTFTILCFASFTRQVGVRATYQGPTTATMPQGLLLRNLDYSPMPSGVLDLLHGQGVAANAAIEQAADAASDPAVGEENAEPTSGGGGGLMASHWWLVPDTSQAGLSYSVARPADGYAQSVRAVMGVDPELVDRWSSLRESFGPMDDGPLREALEGRGVFLPRNVALELGLEAGDELRIAGMPATFAGVIEAGPLQRLRHVDGESILPVDFQDAAALATEGAGGSNAQDEEMLLASEVQRDFVYLSANQVAIAGNGLIRSLGGELHMLSVIPNPEAEPRELARELAQVVVMPVWVAAPEGVERMILTLLTEVSGGLQLAVPLLLGGLIIFGTLLGSISDREKEIYTFSALGLSPGHVGVLFFAEAAVYAVVGGMGGQLLAQVVALVAAQLAQADLIDPPNINYSSTNSLFAIGVVMLTVLVSAVYPALRASKSANPGLARSWQMPKPEGDDLKMTFPFTVSAYDMTGVASFLVEHFNRHDDAGLGSFAVQSGGTKVSRSDDGNLMVDGEFALAPFDLGVTQHLTLMATPSEIPGVDEVQVHARRLSGATGDWFRANKVFAKDLRRQFLLWRTLSADMIEHYRMQTLETLGEQEAATAAARSETAPPSADPPPATGAPAPA